MRTPAVERALDPIRHLTPCFIGSGTLVNPRDMFRALETLEAVDYVYEIDGAPVDEGEATLVKLMADGDSATMAVNGCLFLNVASFRYLDFGADEDGACVVRLYGDGATLTLRADSDREAVELPRGQLRLLEEAMFDAQTFVISDDEDDDD